MHMRTRAHGDRRPLGLGASSSRLRVTLCYVGALNTQDTPASLSKRFEAAAAVALGVVGSVHETRGTEPAEARVPGAELEQRGLRGGAAQCARGLLPIASLLRHLLHVCLRQLQQLRQHRWLLEPLLPPPLLALLPPLPPLA